MTCPRQVLLNTGTLARFVFGLTGLRFAILPLSGSDGTRDIDGIGRGCHALVPRSKDVASDSRCTVCAADHVPRALAAPDVGHDFRGPCGARTFLLPLDRPAETVQFLAMLQARRPEGVNTRGSEEEDPRGDDCFASAMHHVRRLAREVNWTSENGGIADPPCASIVNFAVQVSPPLAHEARAVRMVRQLIERMQREFAEPLELKQLSQAAGLNPSYISVVFAREAGIPFKSFLTKLRLEHAAALLLDSDMSISLVARSAGYSSAHRFRAAFRAWTGLSPARWRAVRPTPRRG